MTKRTTGILEHCILNDNSCIHIIQTSTTCIAHCRNIVSNLFWFAFFIEHITTSWLPSFLNHEYHVRCMLILTTKTTKFQIKPELYWSGKSTLDHYRGLIMDLVGTWVVVRPLALLEMRPQLRPWSLSGYDITKSWPRDIKVVVLR